MHDIADFEGRRLPGVFVASAAFGEAAEAQAQALGIRPRGVFVAHPIQDRTDDEMRRLADVSFDEIVSGLTT